jgi:MOSC domain-containing protein YiiM
MKVVSVNRGETKTVNYQGAEVKTGVFKYSVNGPIYLGDTDVANDSVVDRRFHGGKEKAVYSYSLDHYPFWKKMFPDLDWQCGMFGENLTIEGMDESKMLIGSIYQVGEAKIQVCQPRQPCFKLGVRFGTQSVLKLFINEPYPGVYFKVIKEGKVNPGDTLELVSEDLESPSIAAVYKLMYSKQDGCESLIQSAISNQILPEPCKNRIKQTQKP